MTYIPDGGYHDLGFDSTDLTWSECRSSYLIQFCLKFGMIRSTGATTASLFIKYIESHGCDVDESLNPDHPDHPPIYDTWNHKFGGVDPTTGMSYTDLNKMIIQPPYNTGGNVGVFDDEGNYDSFFAKTLFLQVPCNKPCVATGATVASETKSFKTFGPQRPDSSSYIRDLGLKMGSFKSQPVLTTPMYKIINCFANNGVWTGTTNWPQNRVDRVNECFAEQMDAINEGLKALPNCEIANQFCPEGIQPDFSNFDSFNYRSQNERRMLERGFDDVMTTKMHPNHLEISKMHAQLRGLPN